MSSETTASEEQHIATLVHSDEYAKNPNQVASLSSHRLLFVKRKELALKPFELMHFPMAECTEITYEVTYAIVRMMFGTLLVTLIAWFFIAGEVAPGTSVPIGLLGLAAIIGTNLAIGVKRHRLIFRVQGRKLKWKSKAGDFKYKVASVNQIVAFARDRGLLREKAS